MTKATSETTKLNFITDQGSIRATVRCACLTDRFGADCCGWLRDGFAGSAAAAGPGLVAVAADPRPPRLALAFGSDLRKLRAGDDGD
jgi:hypothetical protein